MHFWFNRIWWRHLLTLCSVGGIVASAMRGRIKCDNTLDRSVVWIRPWLLPLLVNNFPRNLSVVWSKLSKVSSQWCACSCSQVKSTNAGQTLVSTPWSTRNRRGYIPDAKLVSCVSPNVINSTSCFVFVLRWCPMAMIEKTTQWAVVIDESSNSYTYFCTDPFT